MKKIKVIFPDGSIAEVEESDLQGALSAGAKRYSGVKQELMAFPDGSTAEINESDINGAIKAGAVKKKETSNNVVANGSPTTASPFGMRSLMGNPLSLQGAPEPEVSSIVDYWKEEQASGDPSRIAKVKNDIVKFNANRNPTTLTASDKADIFRLTGTDVPELQRTILNELQRQGNDANRFTSTDVVGGKEQTTRKRITNPEKDSPLSPDELQNISGYLQKLEYKLDKKIDNKWSNKNQLTIGGKETTGLEELMNLINPVGMSPVAAVQEARRFNSEKLTDSFSTGLESIKDSDSKEYERIKNIIESGRPLPTTDVIRLTSAGSKIIADKTAQGVVDGEIDADQFATINESLSKDLDNNVYKHPDFLRSLMSDVISKHYEKDGGVVFSKWMVTDKEIDAVPVNKFVEAGLDPNNPEFKKQLSFLKEKEGWMPFQNAIAKDDLFREFKKGFASVPKGIVSTAESLVADDYILMADEATKQFNVSETANRRGEYFEKNYGVIADAFQGLGQFSAQLATMYGGSTAIGAAGEALGGGTTASFLMNATRLQRLGNTLNSGKDLYATYGVPFVMSYGDYYKEALGKGANPLQAKMMAFTNASMEGVSETLFDNLAFGRQVAKDLFNKQNYNKIAKIFDRGVLDEASQTAYKETLQEIIAKTAKTFGKAGLGAVKESFEEVPVALTNFIVDAAANPENVEGRNVGVEMKDAFLDGLVSFSIPSLVGLGGSLNQQFKKEKLAHESLMIAAMQRPFVEEAINNLVAKGEITQAQANEKIAILNSAAQQLQELPKTYADGEDLSPLDREKYLTLSVKEKVLSEQVKNGDGAIKKIATAQIDEITTLKESILNKTPAEEERRDTFKVEVEDNTQPTPEEKIVELVNGGAILGGAEMAIKADPSQATEALRFIAQQAYGITETGDKAVGGIAEIENKEALAAAKEKFPTPESTLQAQDPPVQPTPSVQSDEKVGEEKMDLSVEEVKKIIPNTRIINKNDEPLKVYHGTRGDGKFNEFTNGDIGFHFGRKEAASQRGDVLIEAYLDIKNPLDIKDKGAFEGQELVDALYEKKVLTDEEYKYFTKEMNELPVEEIYGYDTDINKQLRDKIKEKGYDGFTYTNMYEGAAGKSFIALDKNQIVFADRRNTPLPSNGVSNGAGNVAPNPSEEKPNQGTTPERSVATDVQSENKKPDTQSPSSSNAPKEEVVSKNDGGNSVGGDKVFYHGTPNKEFNGEFDERKIGERDSGFIGRGFYFTEEKSIADQYQYKGGKKGKIIERKLDIKNPLLLDKEHINPQDLAKDVFKYIDEERQKKGKEPYRQEKREDDIAELTKGLTEAKHGTIVGRELSGWIDISDYAKSRGYDAIIGSKEVVVFDKSQIKAVEQSLKEQPKAEGVNTKEQVKQVKLSDLPDRAFAVGMDKEKADKIKKQLAEQGFTQPIIIDKESGNVLDGQRRLMIAEEMGIEEVPAIYMDNPTKTELNEKIKELEKLTLNTKEQATQKDAISEVGGEGQESQPVSEEVIPASEIDTATPIAPDRVDSVVKSLRDAAKKIRSIDITGSGGGSALADLTKIPSNIIAFSIDRVADAIQAGKTIVEAIKAGMDYLTEQGHPNADNKGNYTEYVKSLLSGTRPKVKSEGNVNTVKTGKEKEEKSKSDKTASTKLTSAESKIIRDVLDKKIDEKNFPSFIDQNPQLVQQTSITQAEGQGRAALDGTYVKAYLEDLRSISLGNARILQDALGENWKEKVIVFLEENPTAGNIAQVSGLLNVINTDINNDISKSKNGTETSKSKDLQARADRITYDTGRSASLALNQRRLYQDFGQGKDVVDILSSIILTPEQQAAKANIEKVLNQKFTDDELNKPKTRKPRKPQPKKPPKPKEEDSVKEDLISKGQKAAQQTDADGNVTTVTLKDKINQANEALKGFKC